MSASLWPRDAVGPCLAFAFEAPRDSLVDDVVDAASLAFEREHGGCGGVVEVDERGDAAAVARDRELALAYWLDPLVVRGAVEGAVAKRDPAGLARGGP